MFLHFAAGKVMCWIMGAVLDSCWVCYEIHIVCTVLSS